MNILCIGDVVGEPGCEKVISCLPQLKRSENIDFVIVNGENSAEGNGIMPKSAEMLFTAGADVITGGNHTWRRREIYDRLESDEFMLRPANMPSSLPGKGMCIADLGHTRIAVINILGTVYMESTRSPFEVCDELIDSAKSQGVKLIFVDFHAEATSEKRAMGFYLDSRITALFGTHTHVQTNDLQILPGGTGYITDIGMTGVKQSVLGVRTDIALKKMKDKLPVRFYGAKGEAMLNGCIFTVNKESGRTTAVKMINF